MGTTPTQKKTKGTFALRGFLAAKIGIRGVERGRAGNCAPATASPRCGSDYEGNGAGDHRRQ